MGKSSCFREERRDPARAIGKDVPFATRAFRKNVGRTARAFGKGVSARDPSGLSRTPLGVSGRTSPAPMEFVADPGLRFLRTLVRRQPTGADIRCRLVRPDPPSLVQYPLVPIGTIQIDLWVGRKFRAAAYWPTRADGYRSGRWTQFDDTAPACSSEGIERERALYGQDTTRR